MLNDIEYYYTFYYMFFILPWGHNNESVTFLEEALLSRGVMTSKQLRKLYKSCKRVDPPLDEYQYYEYWVELYQICENYDWDLYMSDPVDHCVEHMYFAFDPGSNTKPMYQYPYNSIYEYVAYMENVIVSLLYGTLDELRSEFYNDIREYARFLEKFALECDNKVIDELDTQLWFHPMRRYIQIRFNDLSENIAFLEYHILDQHLLCKKALRRMRKYSGNDTGYIIMLQCTLYGML